MVWEEFGIANGLMPDDPGLWLANARDRFLRRRNHACILLWCTANETIPDDPILSEMPKMAEALDGTRLFLHCSTQTPPTNGTDHTRPGRQASTSKIWPAAFVGAGIAHDSVGGEHAAHDAREQAVASE